MITRFPIDCAGIRPDALPLPLIVPCGSPLTVFVTGLVSRAGCSVTGCKVAIMNANGTALTVTAARTPGGFSASFPASHFANYGIVKNGVLVYAVGKNEADTATEWIVRVGDVKILQISASNTPGSGGSTSTVGEVYHKSEIVDGVQHYKMEVLSYSATQGAWGADFVGDYIYQNGAFVAYTASDTDDDDEEA